MTGYLAKRKKDEEQPCEEDWDLEVLSNNIHFVEYDKYGSHNVSSFGHVNLAFQTVEARFSQKGQLLYPYHIFVFWYRNYGGG